MTSCSTDAAVYLAAAGALLEQFDPDTSLQAIVDLAVPKLADWCYVHLVDADGRVRVAAASHADPARLAEMRSHLVHGFVPSPTSAIARVLAGGGKQLVHVDEQALQRAARDADHLARLRTVGYRSAVIAPLTGRDGVLGAITFTMAAESGRTYEGADLDMLGELARRTGIALDNARLFAAEQQARKAAEAARDRTRRLHDLTVALSRAVEERDVVSIFVDAGRGAIGATAAFAWQLRDTDELELVASQHDGRAFLGSHQAIPMSQPLPVCESVRTGTTYMFETIAAMQAAFPAAAPPPGSRYRARAIVPYGGPGVGAVLFSFDEDREFSTEDREVLAAMSGQVTLALDRCRLIEAERRARADSEQARLRERQLHVLAARLSSALTRQQIATISCTEVVAVLGAISGATALAVGDEVHILGTGGQRDEQLVATIARVPMTAGVPIAEAIHTSALVWSSSRAELASRYAHLEAIWTAHDIRSWGALPFTFEGHTTGSIGVSFADERSLSTADQQFLAAVGQLVAQALERARLYEALEERKQQLDTALKAGRTGTWRVDLRTMHATRDQSYRELIGAGEENSPTDFMVIHPEDRDRVQLDFKRAITEGVPYEPELRIQRADGSYIWIRAHGQVIYDEDGKPRSITGVIVDIDEAKQASLHAETERRINETMHRLTSLFASELDQPRLVTLIVDELSKHVGADVGKLDVSSEPLADMMSEIAVPVVAPSGTSFGTLRLGHRAAGHFSEQDRKLVTSVAQQAAVALDNAHLYTTVRVHKEYLEVAVARAKEADRRKDEFLAMLGHELRNPLAPISTALELMGLKDNAGHTRERAVIARQVDHLKRLVDDLLDVSRITRGKIQLSRHVQEISAILAKALETASPAFEKRMQRVTIEAPRSGMLVDADTTRLAQVFQNLLVNAAKYSDPSTEVIVRARTEGERVVVEIRDQGIGITPELQTKLFDLFVQGERTLARSEGGLGIGLTVARSLCELHGGTISAHSDGPGTGSTFTVVLPRSLAVAETPELVERSGLAPSLQGARVLVVDDNVDAALMLRECLLALGHEPAVAHDGAEALALAASFKPDIAVLDIGLPVMDGYELARKLREHFGPDKLRLIALTGYGQERDRAQSREVGFDHHIVKPVNLDMLVPLLSKNR